MKLYLFYFSQQKKKSKNIRINPNHENSKGQNKKNKQFNSSFCCRLFEF